MNLPVEFLDKSKTAFHACANAAGLLKENGFELLPTWQDALSRYLKEIEY